MPQVLRGLSFTLLPDNPCGDERLTYFEAQNKPQSLSPLAMHPTPDISHLTSEDYEHVYEPAEDSFLLMDALESDREHLTSLSPGVCLEVGCGSGIVSCFIASLLGPKNLYMCTDINRKAANIAARTAAQNKVNLEPVVTDLVSGLLPRLAGQVDVLLFNPPYVVTPSEEVGSKGIEASWAGGVAGREVTDRFLPLVSHLLSPHGIFYLVAIKENKPDELAAVLSEEGLTAETLLERRAGPERLSVLRFSRATHAQ